MVVKYKPLLLSGIILGAILLPLLLKDPYLRHLFVLTMIFSILALSLDLIMGHMGQFSFGHQAFFGVGAYTTAILTVKMGLPPWLGFFAGIVLATIFGVCIGFISLRRTRGLYLAILTLGFGKIIWLIANNWFSLTGGTQGIPLVPYLSIWVPVFGRIVLDSEFSYYYFALFILILTLYIMKTFLDSRFGRAVTGIRENEDLAVALGINSLKYYLIAFTFSCMVAGIAGVTYAHFVCHVAPISLSMHYMFWMIVMVVVGGMQTLAGPILGAFIFVFVPEWLRTLPEFRSLATGIIVLVFIIFMRNGIVPFFLSIVKQRKIWGTIR